MSQMLIISLMLIALFSGSAYAGAANCADFEFPVDDAGQIDWSHSVKVIRQNAAVFPDATSSAPLDQLVVHFNDTLRVVSAQDSRLEVRRSNAYEPLGWVDRSALLCGIVPLKSDDGLDLKFYVTSAGKGKAYASHLPEKRACHGQCQDIEPVQGFFVFDEEAGSFLLGDTYFLDDISKLVGWVRNDEGFLWNRAYGLRPGEELEFPAGHPFSGMERRICAYASPQEAAQSPVTGCLPISGGTPWYRSTLRIPVIERVSYQEKLLYHVLLPIAGLTFALPGQPGAAGNIEAYIPASEDIVEEMWLKSDDLNRFISLLREFDVSQLQPLQGAELRQAFVFALADALVKILRIPLYENTEEPLKDYLQRQGSLPVRDDSPLFRYSISELMNPDIVPDCEIRLLLNWTDMSQQILSIVYHGDRRPVYTAERFPGECPTAGDIPFIVSEISSEPLGEPDMRYNHHFQKANVYWVPKEFLP